MSVRPSIEFMDFTMNVSGIGRMTVPAFLLLLFFIRRQKKIQYKVVENVHRLFQLLACCGYRRRENFVYARRLESGVVEYGTD